MSLYGMMRTGVSGMAGQASRLSTVADNIANSSTNGYKRSTTEFSSLIIPNPPGSYVSGGITTTVRYAVAQQGNLQYTTSVSDLAISGDGFFVVQDGNGSPFLTRAGSFVPDGEGRLVNAAGFYLLGYNFENGPPSAVTNGFTGLEPVTISETGLAATPSTAGVFSANLPSGADIVAAADLPSANAATATYSAKSSLVVYDNLGAEVLLDIYFTKTADNTWEVAVYDQATAAAGGSFPYSAAALSTETLTFDPANGQYTAASPTAITVPIPGGASFDLDLSSVTQLATQYTVLDAEVNGNAPSAIDQIEIGEDGTVYAQYENGSFRALYRIPIAAVQSPDQLAVLPGNVFSQSTNSGDVRVGFAGEGGMGNVVSGALENSNVDIAQELTSMIEAQRSYTANSKVFQTGSDLLDILVNLKR
jgi:flagellar hook protein FlgE